MLTYIKVRIDGVDFGERFWVLKIDEDDNFIYGVIRNDILTTSKFHYGDLIKVNKETYEVSINDKDIFSNSERLEMIQPLIELARMPLYNQTR